MEAGVNRAGQLPVPEPEPEHWPRLEDSLKSLLFGAEALSSGPPPLKPFQAGFQQPLRPEQYNSYKKSPEGSESDSDLLDISQMSKEQLRAALLDQCMKEDFALLQVGSENFNEKLTHYRRPEFVSQYLRRNDIRPLQKVIQTLFLFLVTNCFNDSWSALNTGKEKCGCFTNLMASIGLLAICHIKFPSKFLLQRAFELNFLEFIFLPDSVSQPSISQRHSNPITKFVISPKGRIASFDFWPLCRRDS